MINELKKLLNENNISQEDQKKIIKGFKFIPFKKRKLIFRALAGHPEIISDFINLMNMKIDSTNEMSNKDIDFIIREEENLLRESLKSI